MIDNTWRKSSYSSGQGNCVEVRASEPGIVAVRDSKDKTGPALSFGPEEWATFTEGIKHGEFDI